MSELTRDTINPQLSSALGAKGGGSSLTLSSELLAAAIGLDLEGSPWPPFMPIAQYATRAAAAAQYAEVGIGLDPGAPPYSRLVIDRIQVNSGETAGAIDLGFCATTQLGASNQGQCLDNSLAAAIGQGYVIAPYIRTYTASPGGKLLNVSTNAWRILVAAGVIRDVEFRPLVIKPGFALCIENLQANLALTVCFFGRFYGGG